MPGFQNQQAVWSHHGENASSPTTDLPPQSGSQTGSWQEGHPQPLAAASPLKETAGEAPPSTWVTPGTGWVGLALNTKWLCPWSLSQPLAQRDTPGMLLVSKGCE